MTSASLGSPGVEVSSLGLVLPPDALVTAAAERLVDEAKASGVVLSGKEGLLTGLVRQVLQGALDVEMAE